MFPARKDVGADFAHGDYEFYEWKYPSRELQEGTGIVRGCYEFYEEKYPPRDLPAGAAVTRLGPSPTGFIHLGNLFMAIVNRRLAKQSGGVFILRIEDTDRKREVEGAVPALIEALASFGISFDEGVGLVAGEATGRRGSGTAGEAAGGTAGTAAGGVAGGTAGGTDGTAAGGVAGEAAGGVAGEATGGTAETAGGTAGGVAGEAAGGTDGASACEIVERGDYGPYFQSAREGIYRDFARALVLEGKAYPCFFTEEQIETIRAEQEAAKELPGIYGHWAKWRNADLDLVAKKIRAGEPYVIRFNAGYDSAAIEGAGGAGSTAGAGVISADNADYDSAATEGAGDTGDIAGAERQTISVDDGIRGIITMPKNVMDVVILKKDGLPTYHFAHVIDDHFMRTTQVVRGEEWLSSLPVHIALFRALGFEPPKYNHTALLMKMDDGVKRKLSKRKDPELALSYYAAEGYHPLAIREYMLGLINSDYEEWRMANPEADSDGFIVNTERMGASGMLFDLDKLQHVSRETLARIPAEELADFMLEWAKRENPGAYQVLRENRALLAAALDVGRGGEKPRKDLAYAAQIFAFISYFFDPYFRMEDPLPDNMSAPEARALLEGYLAGYDHEDDRETWFGKIRELAVANGYAAKPKDFKNNPDMYKGHVGDVSTVIRRALTGRQNAPDIYEIQQILGERRTRARLEDAAAVN